MIGIRVIDQIFAQRFFIQLFHRSGNNIENLTEFPVVSPENRQEHREIFTDGKN